MSNATGLMNSTIFFPLTSPFFVFSFNLNQYNPSQMSAIIAYHTVKGVYPADKLNALPAGTQLLTSNGQAVKKVSQATSGTVQLQGSGALTSRIVIPNMYSTPELVIHGISTVLVPPKL